MHTVGVDVGGTYTDIVAYDSAANRLIIAKVDTTPDQADGTVRGIEAALGTVAAARLICHGTTIATNAVIERTGAVCGLLTTRGFEDVLEMRRRDRPRPYGLAGDFRPLIRRRLRIGIDERVTSDGAILRRPDAAAVQSAVAELLQQGVTVLIVSFLNSYANPENELACVAIARGHWPNPYVLSGAEILREVREFERTSTATVTGYVQPLINRYLDSLAERYAQRGFSGSILVSQSNGGLMSVATASQRSANTIISGPAAGVVAGLAFAQETGYKNTITCDMGGTSFDVSIIVDGNAQLTNQRDIAFGIPLCVPTIDVRTIGAGGGSIAWLDRGGILHVGPKSAGSHPGPVAYGHGGTEPTVTDANLVLGRINPEFAMGGQAARVLDHAAAERSIRERIAAPLGVDVNAAAAAILCVVNTNMAGAIRRVSVERGHDPRRFALLAFGGAGPLHANALAAELAMPRVLIPYYPGVFCALGCILADTRHDYVQTVAKELHHLTTAELDAILADFAAFGTALLAAEGTPADRRQFVVEGDMRYRGQSRMIKVVLARSAALPDMETIHQLFTRAYEERYGLSSPKSPVELVNLRLAVIGSRPRPSLFGLAPPVATGADLRPAANRQVYFDGGFVACPVYRRADLPTGRRLAGPLVVEQLDSTCVVHPGTTVAVDEFANLVLEVPPAWG